MVDQFGHHKMQLNVGLGHVGCALQEPPGLRKIGGQQALAMLPPVPQALQQFQAA